MLILYLKDNVINRDYVPGFRCLVASFIDPQFLCRKYFGLCFNLQEFTRWKNLIFLLSKK